MLWWWNTSIISTSALHGLKIALKFKTKTKKKKSLKHPLLLFCPNWPSNNLTRRNPFSLLVSALRHPHPRLFSLLLLPSPLFFLPFHVCASLIVSLSPSCPLLTPPFLPDCGWGQDRWLYHSCTMPGDSSTDRPTNVQIPQWKEDCISVNKAPEHSCGFSVLSRRAEGRAGQRIMGRVWPSFLSQFLSTCWVYITLYWRGTGAAHQRIFWVSEVN